MKPLTGLIAFIVALFIILIVFFGQNALNTAQNRINLFLAGLTPDSRKCESLVQENERLKFELLKYKSDSEQETEEGKTAEVFSRYPFNNKEHLVINLGKKDNVQSGLPVLTVDGYLLGKVVAVRNNRSEVQTIFDPKWKSSVAVGGPETRTVMKGGRPPKLELIPKDSQIEGGGFVFNISPDFPYEKLVGKIEKIKRNSEETWYTASVDVPYNVDKITEVVVLTEFK